MQRFREAESAAGRSATAQSDPGKGARAGLSLEYLKFSRTSGAVAELLFAVRSRRSWASTLSVATGRASRRFTPIGSPVSRPVAVRAVLDCASVPRRSCGSACARGVAAVRSSRLNSDFWCGAIVRVGEVGRLVPSCGGMCAARLPASGTCFHARGCGGSARAAPCSCTPRPLRWTYGLYVARASEQAHPGVCKPRLRQPASGAGAAGRLTATGAGRAGTACGRPWRQAQPWPRRRLDGGLGGLGRRFRGKAWQKLSSWPSLPLQTVLHGHLGPRERRRTRDIQTERPGHQRSRSPVLRGKG